MRDISETRTYDNQLVVGNLTLGYPDDMHEATDVFENGAIPYSSNMLGNALVASSKAISKQDVLYILAAADPAESCTLKDVEENCETLANTVGETYGGGFTRLTFSTEHVKVNEMPGIIVDTIVQEPEQLGGKSARGIIYVLANENEVAVGELEGYFYGDDYDNDPDLYDSIFASVKLVDSSSS